MFSGRKPGSPNSDHAPCPHLQRRPPSTPPLPLRTLQLVARQPETPVGAPVMLRDCRSFRGHVPGVRDSWPKTRQRSRPAPPARTTVQSQPAPPARTTGQSELAPPVRTMDQSQLAPPVRYTDQSRPTTPSSTTDQSVAAPLPGRRGSEGTMTSLLLFCHSSSSNSLIAIDNKIEQAMDLVKSHLMLAVREEVELLRDQIRDLQEKNQQLQRENHILRTLTHNTHNLLNT
ncbi:TSC22 domain family protein 4-like isoform X3 [Etheostoma cragini]|uniref:TSC22 domain family protein 4-like isoform X3 n=1 Tax=Etheostoma cragini TaxID=417921 RepID=UPI00155EFAF1|nr:TSC22 domain family protein 4-like isoform X3 [Etheostoma cragini]